MPNPWEKYQQQPQAQASGGKPWEKYRKDESTPASMAWEGLKGAVGDTLGGLATFAANAVTSPLETGKKVVSGIVKGHMDELGQAADFAKRGDLVSAAGHALYGVMPLVGPAMSQGMAVVTDEAKTGDERARAAGQVAGNLLPVPKVGKLIPERLRVGLKTNPAVEESLRFAEANQIPLDAATATNNMFVRGAQQVAGSTIGGSIPAARGRAAQVDALRRTADDLAEQAGGRPLSPAETGRQLQQTLATSATVKGRASGEAYGELAAIEALPEVRRAVPVDGRTVAMPIPVDVRGIKEWAKPVIRELDQRWAVADPDTAKVIAQQRKSLQSIVDGPDYKPASVAEKDLGALKAWVRNADVPNEGTTRGADAMFQLQKNIDDAVEQIGGEPALRALQKGRANWAGKAEIEETMAMLRDEPVQAFGQTIYRQDRGIEMLKRINAIAPDQMPQLGRSYLQDLFDTAKADGGFAGGVGMANQWKNLGPETKTLLFPNPAHRSQLDQFFRLTERMARVPNTSGTAAAAAAGRSLDTVSAVMGGTGNIVGALATEAGAATFSALMYNPRFVSLLVRGMQLPARSPAQAAALANLMNMAREQQQRETPADVQ